MAKPECILNKKIFPLLPIREVAIGKVNYKKASLVLLIYYKGAICRAFITKNYI
ncbi:hypothetical protein [Staphylococcus succinus]|uniref:hypothetical protein n=1 Tax=Staphylococcus succinus TaxID=61015 RepID=UPI0012E07CDF|nr:hypothetical protein [Staphylococcus succinus]